MEKDKLSKIIGFYKDRKRMPTYREIADMLGYRSKNSVHRLVNKLIEENYLEKDDSGHIVPRELFGSAKLLGSIAAGFPSPAEEELIDTITLDDYLIKNKEATFMLKVEGSSMIDAGIMPGDMVLVERKNDPRDGDIVIAEVDQEWTMKYYRKKNNKPVLYPANKKFKPIYPKEELKIAAVVIAVVRKYQ